MAFDVVFGIVLCLGLIRGLKKGFARQMLTVTGIVAGLMFGETLCREATTMAGDAIQKLPIAGEVRFPVLCVASMLVIWSLIVIVGCMYLKWYRSTVLFTIGPTAGDRLLGGAFGVAKGGLIVCFLCFAFDSAPNWLRNQSGLPAQREASRGFQFANQYPIAERLIQTPEIQRYKDHVARILKHYRPRAADAAENFTARR